MCPKMVVVGASGTTVAGNEYSVEMSAVARKKSMHGTKTYLPVLLGIFKQGLDNRTCALA